MKAGEGTPHPKRRRFNCEPNDFRRHILISLSPPGARKLAIIIILLLVGGLETSLQRHHFSLSNCEILALGKWKQYSIYEVEGTGVEAVAGGE